MKNKLIRAMLLLLFSATVFAQTDVVKSDGITSEMHRANVGRITFMTEAIPLENYKEADFLKTYQLKPAGNLYMRAFLGNSLTNYLHRLAPEMSAEDLIKNGNYQFSFYVDDALVYKENLHVGAGLPEAKLTKTVLSVPLMTTAEVDSWGRFLWKIKSFFEPTCLQIRFPIVFNFYKNIL